MLLETFAQGCDGGGQSHDRGDLSSPPSPTRENPDNSTFLLQVSAVIPDDYLNSNSNKGSMQEKDLRTQKGRILITVNIRQFEYSVDHNLF